MKARSWMAVVTFAALISAPLSYSASEKIGIFETLLESSASFSETTSAIEAAFGESELVLHASHEIRVPDGAHQAKIYVFTSPSYADATAGESVRTVSAQVLRIAVYTHGDDQKTFVNMANPLAHAMVFYAKSANYEKVFGAAVDAQTEVYKLLDAVSGKVIRRQAEPMRTEKHYRKFKGDGPARMMAKFRTFQKSQLLIQKDTAENFDVVVERVAANLAASEVSDASDSVGWQTITTIRLRDDAVYIGLTNPFIEDKMIRINSRFRGDSKSDLSPYPGVDHVAALPTEVLIVKEGDETLVLHYGQMWRMQLYFWDSGYRAFTANMGVPGKIAKSIESAIEGG